MFPTSPQLAPALRRSLLVAAAAALALGGCSKQAATDAKEDKPDVTVAATKHQPPAGFKDTWRNSPKPAPPAGMDEDPRGEGAIEAAKYCLKLMEWGIYSRTADGLEPMILPESQPHSLLKAHKESGKAENELLQGGSTTVSDFKINYGVEPDSYALLMNLVVTTPQGFDTLTGELDESRVEKAQRVVVVKYEDSAWRCVSVEPLSQS